MRRQPNPKLGLRLLSLLLTVLIAVAALTGCGEKTTQPGEKTIVVAITMADGITIDRTITTEAEYLRGALEQENLVAGDESDYGLFVKTVNGYTIDEAKQEWWCFTKDGETIFTGVDTTPIAQGDHFEITLTVGY